VQHCAESVLKTVSPYNVAVHVCTKADINYAVNALKVIFSSDYPIMAVQLFKCEIPECIWA
jgi:hypothetical protein